MNKHIFIELKDGKVRDANMVTHDRLRAEGWERDAKQPEATVSSDWVQDVATGAKLKDEVCEVWRLKNIVAQVSVNMYPASKQIRPLFGFAKDRCPASTRTAGPQV